MALIRLVRFHFVFLGSLFVLLLAATSSRADTLQAPVGGKAIPVGDGRVACAGTSGDWGIEAGGTAVRPPAADDAAGKSVDMKVAPSAGACASTTATVTLVATGKWPAIDPTATSLFVDDARVELHGHGLRGVEVHWEHDGHSGEDRCVQPQTEGAGEKCAVSVGRGLPADPTLADLRWLPAGARFGADVTTFDANARRVGPDETTLHPARVIVSALVPADVSIDLAGGTASRIPLVHPDAVVGADCGATSCEVSGNVIVVSGLSTVSGSLAVRLRLAPRVYLQQGAAFDSTPVVSVSVLPCAMSIASGDALRGVDGSRVVVRVDARCAGEARSFRWYSGGRALDVLSAVDVAGAVDVLLGVGRVEGDEVVVTASRGGADSSIVGQARAHTRALPPIHATLTLDGGEIIDFVPNNRPATVRWAVSQGAGELVLLPVEGVYDVSVHDSTTTIQGQKGAGGFVSLRFAWRVPTLPGAMATADLAVVSDPVERPMREASVPVPLSASTSGAQPIVEMLCGSGADQQRIMPGVEAHVSYSLRDTCRLVFHRERIPADAGAQHLQLQVDVTRVDGDARPDAHVLQPVVLRSGDQPKLSWIKGVLGQFDRATIRVTRESDPSDPQSATEEEPSVQYSIVFGTSHFRLYGTTAIPTGLFRFSDRNDSGILPVNLGVVMRATWLDGEGHEGFLGLEGGVMVVGLPNATNVSGAALTQIATVTGIGLSVPIANRSLATETSINLHAWFEYEPSRVLSGAPGSPFAFVFGPSISIGNVGTNF